MNLAPIQVIIPATAIFFAVIVLIYIIWREMMKPVKAKHRSKVRGYEKASFFYRLLVRLPFFKSILLIFERLYFDSGSTRIGAKNAAAKNVGKIFVTSMIIPIITVIFIPNPLFWVMSILLIFFTFTSMKNKYVADIYYNDLSMVRELIKDIKTEFTATDDIRLTYNNLALEDPKYVFLVDKIIEILDSEDPDEALSDFFVEAPNKYIKQIVSLSMDVVTYGDTKDHNGQSRFIQGMTILLEEVSQDYLFTREQIEILHFTSVWIFTALSLPYPMVMFTQQLQFFDGAINFMSSYFLYICIYVSWIFAIYIIREYTYLAKVRTEYDIVFAEKAVFSRLLKVKWIRTLVSRVAPTHLKTERSVKIVKKTELKLRDANSNLSVEEFYLQKILSVAIVFILTLAIIPVAFSSYKTTLFNPDWENIKATDSQAGLRKTMAGFEYTLLETLNSKGLPVRDSEGNILVNPDGEPLYNKKFSKEDLKMHVYYEAQHLNFVDSPEDYSERFLDKLDAYKSSNLPWYGIVFSFLVSLTAWGVPDLLLSTKSRDRKWAIENEIEGYLSVLSMISSIKNLKVIDLLDYLERYAVVFKHEMLTARSTFVGDPEGTFSYLEDSIRSEEMAGIVRRMRRSYTDTSIEKAFSDLLPNRKFMLEDRKLSQMRVLEAKRKNLNSIQFTAMAGMMVLYLLIPFAVSALPSLLDGLGAVTDITELGEEY